MNKKKTSTLYGLSLLLALFLMSFSSATIYCSKSSISGTYIQGNSFSQDFTCSNINSNGSATVTSTGQYFSVSPNLLDNSSSTIFNITFDSNAPVGSYSGNIALNAIESSVNIPISFTVASPPAQQQYSDIIVFPTSKIISVQQGTEKTQNILLSVPSNYPSQINIQALNFNPNVEPIKFGDLNLGQVAPGQSIQIPVIFSGKDAEIGFYSTELSILATNSSGQVILPKVNLQLQITAGITPTTNETFISKPSCTISAVIMNVNNSYTLTCSNVQANIEVHPDYNSYFVGERADITGGISTYRFHPVKFGETTFSAFFSYRGYPIFEAYNQTVRISSSGSLVPGTSLKMIFSPEIENIRNKETVAIQIIDNKTGSLVNNPELYINSFVQPNNATNVFFTAFEAGKEYQIRARSPGYEDFVQIVKINPKPIYISISPESGDSETGFSINTSVENSTLTINGNKVSNPFSGVLTAGFNQIIASKEGFEDNSINITVIDSLKIATASEFLKGVPMTIHLNKNTTWQVYLQKGSDPKNPISGLTGTGSDIEFTPKETGIYSVEADGKVLGTYNLVGWNGEWFGIQWFWWIGGIIVFLTGIYVFMAKSGDNDGVGISGNIQV